MHVSASQPASAVDKHVHAAMGVSSCTVYQQQKHGAKKDTGVRAMLPGMLPSMSPVASLQDWTEEA